MTDIEIRTRSVYDSLSPAEQKVARYFLHNMSSVFDDPISALAEKSGVSQVVWVRFCKSLGYTGLKDMKKNLVSQLREPRADSAAPSMDFLDTRVYSSTEDIIHGVEAGALDALRSTARILEPRTLEEVAARMAGAKSVRLFGVGASALDGIFQGLGYTVILIIMCVVREFLGNGTFGGGILNGGEGIRILPEGMPALGMILPVGGFLTLACVIAAMQYFLSRPKKDDKKNEEVAK